MRYTEAEIELARQLRRNGLAWEPQAGNYVYDETAFCKQPSPFQDRVYFILNPELPLLHENRWRRGAVQRDHDVASISTFSGTSRVSLLPAGDSASVAV